MHVSVALGLARHIAFLGDGIQMNQAIVESRVQFALSRAALRIVDHVPAFRRVIYNRMDDE
jgi:hypothetical protein